MTPVGVAWSASGLEYGFSPNWTAGIEYNHMFMQDKTYNLVSNGAFFAPGALVAPIRIRQDVDLVTARINYSFGGPVVATVLIGSAKIYLELKSPGIVRGFFARLTRSARS